MKVRVDLFNERGKYRYGDVVEVGEARLWKGDLYSAIIENQNFVLKGVVERHTAVVTNLDDNDDFCCHLYHPTEPEESKHFGHDSCVGVMQPTCAWLRDGTKITIDRRPDGGIQLKREQSAVVRLA